MGEWELDHGYCGPDTRAGTVKACRRTRLAPSVGGQVERLRVKKGQHVQAGQPLQVVERRSGGAAPVHIAAELLALLVGLVAGTLPARHFARGEQLFGR